MKKEYDFRKGKRGPVVKDKKMAKIPITMRVSGQVLEWAMNESTRLGIGYQTFLHQKLVEAMTEPKLAQLYESAKALFKDLEDMKDELERERAVPPSPGSKGTRKRVTAFE